MQQSAKSPSSQSRKSFTGSSASSKVLDRVTPSLKKAGTQVANRFNQLSTTQKVVGGALLALGVGYLARRNQPAASQSASQADTLNELLYFVNNRIEGYKRAVEESQDEELRGYYKQLVSQSQLFAGELNRALLQLGAERHDHTTLKGKVYRRWMDAKAAVTGHDEKAILGSNVYGEEWALKAYKDALSQGTLSGTTRTAVERQYALSQKTYDKLQKLESKQQ
jgi:uncharacterized protein (TIGR02284 family)